jgi:hypothetical protein
MSMWHQSLSLSLSLSLSVFCVCVPLLTAAASFVAGRPPPGGPIATWLLAGANALWGDANLDGETSICEGWAVDHGKRSTVATSNFGLITIDGSGTNLELVAAT